jgi:hypothetical protein
MIKLRSSSRVGQCVVRVTAERSPPQRSAHKQKHAKYQRLWRPMVLLDRFSYRYVHKWSTIRP